MLCVIRGIRGLLQLFLAPVKDTTSSSHKINPLNAELNPICHLLALLGSATIVVVSRLRVKELSNLE